MVETLIGHVRQRIGGRHLGFPQRDGGSVVRAIRFSVEGRIAQSKQRIVLAAQMASVWPGASKSRIHAALAPTRIARQTKCTRHVLRSHAKILAYRADVRWVVRIGRQSGWIAEAPARHNIERVMRIVTMSHRADECCFVHHPCDVRHMLADLQTRQRSLDGLELTANLHRSCGLQVKHIQLTGAPQQIEQNHGLRGPGWFGNI